PIPRRWDTHYLLSRNTALPQSPFSSHIHTLWLTTPDDPAYPLLLQIAQEQGLDDAWCREQLTAGDPCILAIADGKAVGMGLVTRRVFWIEEILHEFVPGPDGCYFYSTYVSPPYRGRRIQGLLDTRRLHWASAQNLRWCYALVEHPNTPSLRAHYRVGFRPAARIDRLRLRRLSLFHIRQLTATVSSARLTHTGFPRSSSIHIIRNPGP
ncbi:MAG: N-acetyltransferase family protein, partial [Bacillota bacterium]